MPVGKLLWTPDSATVRRSNINSYSKWLGKRGHRFADYEELWRWSVEDIEGFWASIWKYFDVSDVDYVPLSERKMPGAKWFDGAELNFAERLLSRDQDGTALVSRTEARAEKRLTWNELRRKVGALSGKLAEMGVEKGDRVGAFLPNAADSVIAFLACASIGAIWSCCSPDFGAPAVVDRFSQIRPKVLVTVEGYRYGGKWFDKSDTASSIIRSLPSLQHVIVVPSEKVDGSLGNTLAWEDLTKGKASPSFEQVPFAHPLWILYSSGTTGLPKPIVHGHGGILLEHLKELSLHNDIKKGDRFFWFTTTSWMMWNYLVGGLLHGATIVLYDGSPAYPGMGALWDMVEKTDVSFMGVSAVFLSSCIKAGLEPRSTHRLPNLRGIGSTGSPLSSQGFEWVYSSVGEDLWLASISGGTDVCTAFVGGCPTLPVHSGEIQCRCLGAKVEAFDETGKSVVGELGELVVTEPMPSMPLFLWGDEDGSRYRESYFEAFPGVWRHGDWMEISKRGTCVIHGRSDATIKRMGVRIGTSEIYRAVESIPEISDCVAIDLETAGSAPQMILFVATSGGRKLDEELISKIRDRIKADLSPRYVPDRFIQVPGVPRTLNGKKLEVPVKKILMGADPAKVVNLGSLADPAVLDYYVTLAKQMAVARKV